MRTTILTFAEIPFFFFLKPVTVENMNSMEYVHNYESVLISTNQTKPNMIKKMI